MRLFFYLPALDCQKRVNLLHFFSIPSFDVFMNFQKSLEYFGRPLYIT
ncbi:hypothetical protein BAME_01650 [Bacillus sp. M 2-6]|nr:hypothetical protein BAME_01650 [Bacillus sp. M 2-6]PYH24968.1 hypothetical protein US8_00720 [Bacillus altitudinis]